MKVSVMKVSVFGCGCGCGCGKVKGGKSKIINNKVNANAKCGKEK